MRLISLFRQITPKFRDTARLLSSSFNIRCSLVVIFCSLLDIPLLPLAIGLWLLAFGFWLRFYLSVDRLLAPNSCSNSCCLRPSKFNILYSALRPLPLALCFLRSSLVTLRIPRQASSAFKLQHSIFRSSPLTLCPLLRSSD